MRHPLVVAFALGLIVALSARLYAQGVSPAGELPRPVDTDKPAVLSLDELKDGIRRRYEALRALRVVYHLPTPGLDTAKDPLGEWDCEFAYKGEKRRFSSSLNTEGQAGAQTIVFDGESARTYIPLSTTKPSAPIGTIRSPAEKLAHLETDAYTLSLAIPLSDGERASAATSSFYMPYALDAADQIWTVSPTLEIVDAAECHVLRSLRGQSIWIDPSIGFAMRRREIHHELKDKPMGSWPVDRRYSFRDFVKTSESLWLPKAVDTVFYTSLDELGERWNKPRRRASIRVEELTVNDQVADDLFHLAFPPGTNVSDAVRNRSYIVGNSGREIEVERAQE